MKAVNKDEEAENDQISFGDDKSINQTPHNLEGSRNACVTPVLNRKKVSFSQTKYHQMMQGKYKNNKIIIIFPFLHVENELAALTPISQRSSPPYMDRAPDDVLYHSTKEMV